MTGTGNGGRTTRAPYRPLEWTDEMVERFWTWQGQYPEAYFAFQFGDRIAAHIRRHLADCRTVLDYGCGQGFLIPPLVRQGKRVTGADFSATAIDAANARFGGLAGFEGAVTIDRLIADGRAFDAAVSVEVIEHLNDSHLDGFFHNLKRLVRPGGVTIITTPNDEDLDALMIYCPASDRVFHRWQHVRSWRVTDLAEAVESAGLAVSEIFTTDLSRPRWKGPLRWAKDLAKRALGRPDKMPHLVCVARMPAHPADRA